MLYKSSRRSRDRNGFALMPTKNLGDYIDQNSGSGAILMSDRQIKATKRNARKTVTLQAHAGKHFNQLTFATAMDRAQGIKFK